MDCCCNTEDKEVKTTSRTSEEKKELKNRLNKIEGQIKGISNMIDSDRYCGDILIQLSAVEKAVKSLSSQILNRHMKTCVTESIKNGNTEVVDEITDLFMRF